MNGQASGTAVAFSDEELRALLRRVSLGDKPAFRTLYHALYPKLSGYLFRLIRRADDVDDLINDVMWVVWEKAGEFRGEAQVTSWVLGIATFKSYRWQQQWRRQQTISSGQPAPQFEPPEERAHDDALEQGMAQLSAVHRETLELVYFFGYSCDEAAHIMGCPPGTVKTRLHHARKRLRQILQPNLLSTGDAS